uniref:Uncharacterized protein n=1 Tax=Anguilla anguilla TaxID=7936 RepID=A0A0E9RZJ9_ANGAN
MQDCCIFSRVTDCFFMEKKRKKSRCLIIQCLTYAAVLITLEYTCAL